MTANAMHTIEQIESSLWEAADQLRANSKLTSSEYCMPVLGIIFLRHASNRYETALAQIKADQSDGKMPNRPLMKGDFIKRRALMLPETSRYDYLLKLPTGSSLGTALVEAMNAIEEELEPLKGQLPKEYDKFEDTLLEDILRTFDSEALRTASGDLFGRIYEYFLMKFAMQGAQDNGEFLLRPRWCRPSSTSSSRIMALSSTRPAVPAACSCSPVTSLRATGRTPATRSPSTARKRLPPPSDWPR